MNHEYLPADLCAAFSPSLVNSQPQPNASDLYVAAYLALKEIAFETYSQLLVTDAETILESLASRLSRYKGPADAAAFTEWAAKFVKQEAQRYELLHKCMGQYRSAIFSAINECMYCSKSMMDCSIESEDLFEGVVSYVFQHAEDFNKPGYLKEDGHGRVKQLTRICNLAKKHVWFYHNSKLKREMTRVHRNLESGMAIPETLCLSAAEIAAMKPARGTYDAGYSEIGLLE